VNPVGWLHGKYAGAGSGDAAKVETARERSSGHDGLGRIADIDHGNAIIPGCGVEDVSADSQTASRFRDVADFTNGIPIDDFDPDAGQCEQENVALPGHRQDRGTGRVIANADKASISRGFPDGRAVRSGAGQESSIPLKQRLYWILLAFIPSSLMFGVTSYITTEIAPTPLLWTIPLALYLVTFVLAFAGKNLLPERFTSMALCGLALLLTLVLAANATEPTTAIVLLHLSFFFVAATICHHKLAVNRPPAKHLADFYLCVAIGGMLGGLFNALIAPITFNTIIEYPLVIVLACLIQQRDNSEDSPVDRVFDFVWPLGIGVLTVALALLIEGSNVRPVVNVAIVFGAPLVIINHRFRSRPVRFALAIGAVMLGSIVCSEIQNRTLHAERNFFGTLSVRKDPVSATHILYHGNTIHGRQFVDPSLQREPLSYFHRDGPLGKIFEAFNSNITSPNVAVVGLGTGSMACYALPDQHWTFYEINPAVINIAQTAEYFTYLHICGSSSTEIVLGDARLELQNAPNQHYGLIVLDAFNSDAIPIHLMTQEAISLYMSKLATGGILAFHISNRSLKLDAVLANVAERNGATCLSLADEEQNTITGKDPSEWLVMAQHSPAFDSLAKDPRWRKVEGRKGSLAWTDDFSNILRVFRWY